MPDLSACYFCGTALDEPLSEYPVVPLTLSPAPEDQKTVVLCSVCRRKLGKVLDAVLDSIEERPIEATVQQDLGEARESVSADDDGVDGDDEGDDGEAEDVTDDEPTETEWATAGQTSEDGDPAEFEVATAAESESVENGDSADDDSTIAEEAANEETDVSAQEETEAAPADEADEATADDAEPLEDPPTAADGNGEEDDGPHLTALEYTKVMRLLENRDLPVDRDEFRIVATNAYEITPEEFDTVVDAAIDRGLIVEEDGQFVDVE